MTDFLRRTLCLLLTFALTTNPLLATAGGMKADPSAPGARQPGLTAAPNGVPMVNIARPNGKGLSHNMFDEFNVGTAGVILNNSRKAGCSQLGGAVLNNPNLGAGPEARTILNEVTGSSRSRIEGYTEIFGRAADYILANPNGITINGGGFINTPKVTMTTGRPAFDQSGALRSLDVRYGDVRIDGDGLNAANLDTFDIISRTAEINAAMHARTLGITTGYGLFDLPAGEFIALEPDSSGSPRVSIDSSALGGIYAERIKLVGNENGVGVNLNGMIRATDQLTLSADGRIRIKGSVSADRNLSVTSRSDGIEISGTLASGSQALIEAAHDVTLASDAGSDPLLYSKDTRLAASSLVNGGRILADNNLKIDVKGDVDNFNVMFSGEDTTVDAGGAVRNPGQTLSEGTVRINVGAVLENTGKVHAGAGMTVRSGAIDNSGDILSVGPMIIHSVRDTINHGAITTEGHLTVTANSLGNYGSVASGQGQELTADTAIANDGTIHSSGSIVISAGELSNSMTGLLQSIGDLAIDVDSALHNLGNIITESHMAVRSGGSLANSGSLQSHWDMEVLSTAEMTNEGSMHAGGSGTFQSAGTLLNSGEILTLDDLRCAVTGDMTNTGTLHSGGSFQLNLQAGLDNHGDFLSQDEMTLAVSGALNNFGSIASNHDVTLSAGGLLRNAAGADIQAAGASSFHIADTLENSGRMEFNGPATLSIASRFINNAQASVLSADALVFDVNDASENNGVLHSGGSLALHADKLHNGGRIMAQGDSAVTVDNELTNTGFIFSGGAATFNVGDTLHNLRGEILALGDMVLEGLKAGSRMLGLKNDSGTIEALEGGMSIRAKVVRNSNLDFALTPGTKTVSRKGGYFSGSGDKWKHARKLYATLPGASQVTGEPNAIIITPTELQILGFGLDRNVITRSELDAAIAAAEKQFDLHGGNAKDISAVASLKSRLIANGVYMAVQHYQINSKVVAYLESITRDEATGLESGATIAAGNDLNVESESFLNYISHVSTATGDITIDTDEFQNAGHDINEHRSIQWTKAHANRHRSPSLEPEANGVEVVSTPIGHAYGTISAGGKVSISADHVKNGIVEYSGTTDRKTPQTTYASSLTAIPRVVAPSRPESVDQKLAHIDDLIGTLPKGGLFSVNKAPGHRYLIETNPALTSMTLLYGSDYFLSRTGIDLNKTQQQLLGDAFYETRLVREQIFALTGRRFLSDSMSGDAEQMIALMDNALAVREDLNLSVGVALTKEQIAALSSDIVWLETREVDGHEVLVPVVYLCRGSLAAIAQGGSVIIGRDVEIHAAKDTANRGVIKASGDLTINAENVFNTFGTIQGDTVSLAAVDSIFNTSGLIKGRDISIEAGQDIISATAKTTFSAEETKQLTFGLKGDGLRKQGRIPVPGVSSTTRTTSETVGQRASIESTGDLTMQAGRNIGIVGSDVNAGGDATLSAGRNVVITAQELQSHSIGTTGKTKSSFNSQTSKSSTVEAGGSIRIDAGQDIAIHGSRVSAGEDVSIEAGRDVSVTAAKDGYDYYFKQKSKGGFFGGSRSELKTGKVVEHLGSAITGGGDVNVIAGQRKPGDLTVEGSTIRSGGDMSLKASADVLVVSARNEAAHSSQSSKSSLLSKKSSALQTYDSKIVKSELHAGGDIRIESGTAGEGILIRSSDIKAEGNVELKSAGELLIIADSEQSSRHEKSSDSGFARLTPSMKMLTHQESTTIGSELAAGGKIALEARKNVAIQAATINADGPASIVADEGQVSLLTGKDSIYDQKIKQKTGFVTWKLTDKGKAVETIVPTIINTKQGLNIKAANGIVVEYKQTGDFRRDVELLSKNPGLEWMGKLLKRDDIDWQAVQENFQKWNKESSGLAPTATLVVSIAVAAASAGAASSLALSMMGLEVSTITGAVVMAGTQIAATSAQLAMCTALTAGITSLSASLAVSLADAAAGGDLGKNLKGMASEESIRSLMTAMLTAGVLSTTDSTFNLYTAEGQILANTAVRTLVRTVAGGEELEGALLSSLAASIANFMTDKITEKQLDDSLKLVIAGATGAASAAALGQDPVQGAMSAIIAQMADTYLVPELTDEQKMRDGPMARLSQCAYNEDCKGTDGYQLLSDEALSKININPNKLIDNESGFRAKIFYNEKNKEFVISFTGTNDLKDIGADFAQAFGFVGDQYKHAGDESILDKLNIYSRETGCTISTTGHSLGGGLAIAVATTGYIDRAIVFNTAGVHSNTIEAIGGNIEIAKSVTTAYNSRGDILNNLQDISSLPSAIGTRIIIEGGGLHGIDALVEKFKMHQ
jgi:filamentous hemagglutinin